MFKLWLAGQRVPINWELPGDEPAMTWKLASVMQHCKNCKRITCIYPLVAEPTGPLVDENDIDILPFVSISWAVCMDAQWVGWLCQGVLDIKSSKHTNQLAVTISQQDIWI